ncbi:DUF2785 domain-containing protein [Kitasatospora viridis]|uniref:Uncharacterized protein DUF2785 n=1 Tax=Kitasatospora viridis TaxID=281105 RepID=A0A561UN74_9ACTN|nr:DUF2785 domain-containing protein [Kitasatospora viridis]TWG00815.1 uncharacterized protein DUF2785 [Kitasatospora viridis]
MPHFTAPDFPFPSDVPVVGLAEQLSEMLASPDPVVRDDHAYTALARWTREGHLDELLVPLGDAAVDRLTHPEVQARSFAPLVLRCVLARDLVDAQTAERWYAAFADWYPAEPDTRGWDDRLGWLHAVAHGADAAAAFARALPHRAPDLLQLCARRFTADTPHRYQQLEDARLARALTALLATPGLTEPAATAWLDVPATALADGGPGPVPPWACNTFATLQALHLHLARGLAEGGVPPHAGAVGEGVLGILRLPFPWLG